MNKTDLQNLNLETHEINIYWHLLHKDKMTVYQLAKDLKTPRSSMYGYVDALVIKGFLVWKNAKSSKRYIEAVPPEGIQLAVQKKRLKLDTYEDTLTQLSNHLELVNKQPLQMNIKYYEGVKGLEQIIWNTLSCKSGNMYGLSDWDRNHYLSKKFVDLHIKEVWLRGPVDHIITKAGRVTNVKKHLKKYKLEIRALPTDKFTINGDTYIYDNIFASTVFVDDKIFGFEIENEEFAKLQLSIFMLLWDIAEEVK